MSLFDSIVEDVESYVGLGAPKPTTLAVELASIVSEHTAAVYLDRDKLARVLRASGVDETNIFRLCLITTVSGFRELIDMDTRTVQSDLNRFVRNAVADTGLNRKATMELVGAIAHSVGVAIEVSQIDDIDTYDASEQAFVIPASIYEEELQRFDRALVRAWREGTLVDSDDVARIEPLVAAGIPKAKYYLGVCILRGLSESDDVSLAISLPKAAAAAGDTQAAAELGDYYYDYGIYGWNQAFEYYTGFGAAALTTRRRAHLTAILNHKRYVRRILRLCLGLACAMLLTVLVAPGADVYGSHRVVGALCTLTAAALLVAAKLHNRQAPLDNVFFVPAGMFVAFSLYIAVRLLL